MEPITTSDKKDDGEKQFSIVLPCDTQQFGDFVSSLLGKPQTIMCAYSGPFEVNRHDIENFYHLVIQRVTQQNEATLLQFTTRIVYDDGSSVLLNSLQDFQDYAEVRPLVSTGVHLSWSFLVKFQDRKIPEKQEIDVSIVSEGERVLGDGCSFPFVVPGVAPVGIATRISHTARTWGADIEAMLSGHIRTLIHPLGSVKRFIRRHNGWIGLGVGVALFLSAIGSSFYTTNRVLENHVAAAHALSQQDPTLPATTSAKVDFLIDTLGSGMWPRYFYYLACFLALALVVSVVAGIWTSATADRNKPSFLLLSKRAETRKQHLMAKERRSWLAFTTSLVVNLIVGVAGNYTFAYFFQGWRSH